MLVRITTLTAILIINGCASIQYPLPIQPPSHSEINSKECLALGNPVIATRGAIPRYPTNALRAGQGGWVSLQYDVVKGKVENISVIDASPKNIFEKSAVSALSHWQYDRSKSATGCVAPIDFNVE